eukprot:scaffold279_cov229-Pinguiococcus_pyrenoidosus.AAC.15
MSSFPYPCGPSSPALHCAAAVAPRSFSFPSASEVPRSPQAPKQSVSVLEYRRASSSALCSQTVSECKSQCPA